MDDLRNEILDKMLIIEKETPNDFELGNRIRHMLKEITNKTKSESIGEIEGNVISKKIKL